ncbi:pitrilysin family protein [Sphingobium sp. AN558]|uniref:M16 family metallopeptidase n=1 Tax=Sphingobium sp. AN558 TaxID=3133442 RepID=UPI0030BC6EE4
MTKLSPSRRLIVSLALSASFLAPVALARGAPDAPAPVASLAARIDIPYEQFTLKNGLRVIVHTDRKAPVVGVTVYYRVGSKNEPTGKTGFAHLFEHLMFGGSENVTSFDEPLTAAGSTPTNGSTWYDRTNYVETVPTGALDLALFMEADRMGRLLGAVTQAKLDAQRGVVQNEKRQNDNQPFGLVSYAQSEALFPAGHPYGHDTIGSMADLDAASLADVHGWFRDHYGPNNAVIALAGDIDVATARRKVERYFGAIAAGKAVQPVAAPVPTLPARVDQAMKDRVATTRLYRDWIVPGMGDPDNAPLAVAADVLGGLASSRLDNILVRQEQLAVAVTASVQTFEQLAQFEVTVDVKPGVDPSLVSKRLDAIITDLIARGPTADEVGRVATRQIAGQIAGLEIVGGFSGKASTLAEGALYKNDPAFYRKELAALAAVTPASATAAMGKWLSRPVYALRVDPGPRADYAEAQGPAKEASAQDVAASLPKPRLPLPAVTASPALDYPAVETSSLSNGIKVHFARRSAVPMLLVSLSFDSGIAADPRDKLGVGQFTLSMLDEGTTSRNAIQIAEEQERLGANISAGATMDRSVVTLRALTANLGPSLDLLADIVKNPAFAPKEVDRVRAIQLSQIAQEKTQPSGLASRAIFPLLYGPGHPYGVPAHGLGDSAAVTALTPADLAAYKNKWLRPDNVEIFVVGDSTLAQIKPLLEARFTAWRSTRDMKGVKDFSAPIPASRPGITLIDRPQSPQSVLLGGFVTGLKGGDDLVAFGAANSVLGEDFLSRINTDIREVKAWSYGAGSYLAERAERSPYLISAPVQADKTGPAIAAIQQDIADFLGPKGVTPAEFSRVVKGNIAALPGQFETSSAILGEMRQDALFGRPFDYVTSLARRYQTLTPAALDQAARAVIDPAKIRWIVVGDKTQVLPQLQALKLPVTVIEGEKAPMP